MAVRPSVWLDPWLLICFCEAGVGAGGGCFVPLSNQFSTPSFSVNMAEVTPLGPRVRILSSHNLQSLGSCLRTPVPNPQGREFHWPSLSDMFLLSPISCG